MGELKKKGAKRYAAIEQLGCGKTQLGCGKTQLGCGEPRSPRCGNVGCGLRRFTYGKKHSLRDRKEITGQFIYDPREIEIVEMDKQKKDCLKVHGLSKNRDDFVLNCMGKTSEWWYVLDKRLTEIPLGTFQHDLRKPRRTTLDNVQLWKSDTDKFIEDLLKAVKANNDCLMGNGVNQRIRSRSQRSREDTMSPVVHSRPSLPWGRQPSATKEIRLRQMTS